MANFQKAATTKEVPEGKMKTVFVGGKRIALANVAGRYFAIDDACTHAHCSLGSEGILEGNVITCGCHGAQFDVTSGKVLAMPATQDEGSYEVKVEGEDIYIGV